MPSEQTNDTASRILAASRAMLAQAKSRCGANATGGGGFQRGNTCARGSGKDTQLELWGMMEDDKPAKASDSIAESKDKKGGKKTKRGGKQGKDGGQKLIKDDILTLWQAGEVHELSNTLGDMEDGKETFFKYEDANVGYEYPVFVYGDEKVFNKYQRALIEHSQARGIDLPIHEDTIEGHADSNVSTAIDQANEYGGLRGAFDAFYQNTVDSAIEDGYTAEQAMDAGSWFATKFNQKTGEEF